MQRNERRTGWAMPSMAPWRKPINPSQIPQEPSLSGSSLPVAILPLAVAVLGSFCAVVLMVMSSFKKKHSQRIYKNDQTVAEIMYSATNTPCDTNQCAITQHYALHSIYFIASKNGMRKECPIDWRRAITSAHNFWSLSRFKPLGRPGNQHNPAVSHLTLGACNHFLSYSLAIHNVYVYVFRWRTFKFTY